MLTDDIKALSPTDEDYFGVDEIVKYKLDAKRAALNEAVDAVKGVEDRFKAEVKLCLNELGNRNINKSRKLELLEVLKVLYYVEHGLGKDYQKAMYKARKLVEIAWEP